MSPTIEAGGSVDLKINNRSYFKVDLNTQADLDLKVFDETAKQTDSSDTGPSLKFIVTGDVMYIFSRDIQHIQFANKMDLKDLQCAGTLKITPTEFKYILKNGSETLDNGKMLSMDASNEYFYSKLLPTLGEEFKPEN